MIFKPGVERATLLAVALIAAGVIAGHNERIDYKGAEVVPLDEAGVRQAVQELLDAGVEAIAVSLLWSFRNPQHERRIREIIHELAPDLYVGLSSDVSPRIREYPRSATTIMNTQVGPRLYQPLGLDVDAKGNVFVTTGPEVVEIPANGGRDRLVVENLDYPVGVAVNADDDVFVSIRGTGQVVVVPANGGRMRTVIRDLNRPNGLTLQANHLFVADTNHNRVMKASAGGGIPTAVVHGLNRPFGVAVYGG